jgi:PAS domain S-box-containing protein
VVLNTSSVYDENESGICRERSRARKQVLEGSSGAVRDGLVHSPVHAAPHQKGISLVKARCKHSPAPKGLRARAEQLLGKRPGKIASMSQEEALRRSEERYRLLFASSRDAIMTVEPPSWRFTSGNPATVDMFRTGDVNRFLRTAPWELSPEFQPDGRPSIEAAKAMIEVAMRQGSHYFEWRHKRLDGEEFPASVLLTRVGLEGRTFLQATVRDITERKRAEERIAQLSRVQTVLAGIDRAIVHLPDRQKLLDEVCRVGVEEGGFKLAWIGMVAPDGSVQPVAQAGATGYLKGIRVVTQDVLEGRGPVGTAIRENRPVVVEDIDQDARMAPWHDRALKFGLHYVAAFPLRVAGKVAGAFQVYAPRADFFDENELGLLGQVSDEISFALTAIADMTARKQAEEALLDSNRFNQQIIASAKDGIIVYGRDLKYLVWNPRMEEISGVPAAGVIGQHPLEVFPFLREAGLLERLSRALAGATGPPLDFQYQVPQSGRSGWVSDINAPLRNAKGEIIGVIGVVHDITRRKLKEEALRASENELAAIYENTPLIMLLVDSDRRVCKMNRFAKNFAKCRSPRRHRLTHGEALRCLHTLDDAKGCGFGPHCQDCTIRCTVLDTLKTGRRHRQVAVSLPFSHLGQVKTLMLLLSSTRLQVRGQPHVLVTLENITEREQAEQLLRHSERNLTDFFNQAPIGLEWLSASGSILRANQAQLDLLGYSPEEYLGHFFGEFCADPASARGLLERLAARETVRNLRMPFRRKDGGLRFILVDATPVWEAGQSPYWSIFSRDITERVHLERTILEISEREQRRIAQDLHDGLGQLLAGTAYLGNTLRQELATKSLPEVRQLDRLLQVLDEAIGQTRSLARGLHPVKPEPNGLMVALKDLASRTETLFNVRCRFLCRQPIFIEDNKTATHLYRIAQEAITNAIKHGKPGRVEISLTQTPGRINLAVKDNGVGLPTRPHKNPGMGLRIMRYRAGTIGGSLAIQKGAGGGTTVACTVHEPTDGSIKDGEQAMKNKD